ncbi:MAG: hypothetical protein EA402_02215 [Planctomycetota bacterium]|nr:MAG: hypothetical protein EA402_02215 [Planctomycetota bacterium]
MRAFLTLVIDDTGHPDAAVRQKVGTRLQEHGWLSWVQGHKGKVPLPRGMYACVRPCPAPDYEDPLHQLRRSANEECSQLLEQVGFRGHYFLTVSTACCWAHRPLPRRNGVGKGSDLDQLDLGSDAAINSPS